MPTETTTTPPQPAVEGHGGFALVYRRILKGSGIYSIVTLAYRCSSIVMLPLFTRCLTPSEYGAMEILDISLNVFGMIFGANFATALFYHYNAAESESERKAVISTTVLGSALLGFVAASIGIAVSSPLSMFVFQQPDYAFYLRIMLVNFALTLPLEAVLQWLRAIDRAYAFVAASVIRIGVAAVLNIIMLLFLRMGLAGVVYSSVITTTLLAVVMSAYCLNQNSLTFQARLFRRLFRYSIPVTLTGIALFTIHYVDRFILKRYVTLAEIGVYSLAYKIGMLISNVHMSFQSYWTAQMYQLLVGRTGERLFSAVFTYVLLFLTGVGVLLSVFSGPAITIIAAPDYWGARILVPYILLAYVLRAVGDHFRGLFYTENRPDLDARLNWIGAAVCIAAYAVLIPRYKVWGAILATFLAFATIALLGLKWIRRLRPIELEGTRVFKIAVSAGLAVAVSHLIPNSSLPATLALNSAAFLLFPAGLWVLRFANHDERALLRTGWGRVRAALRPAGGAA